MSKWPQVQLRHVAKLKYGDSLAAEERRDDGVPVFGSNGPVGLHDRPNTQSPVLVVGRKGSFGKVQFSPDPVFAIDTTYFIDGSTTIHDIRWLYYALSTLCLDSLSQDVGVPGLSREAAYSQRLALPSSKSQRAIADFLDTETARIDALIAKKQRMIGVLHERFGVALAAVFAAVDAPRRKLSAVAHVSLGRQRNPASDSGPDMVPYLRAANVKDGSLDLTDVKQMNFAPHEQRIFALKPGDVLVTEGAGSLAAVGASTAFHGELQSPVCFQNTLIRLRARQGVRADYLAWWTRFAYRTGVLADLAGGANIFHIGAERMQTLALPVPLEGVQGEVVNRLGRVETAHLALVERLERQVDLLREHRQALITAAVTGELEITGVAA